MSIIKEFLQKILDEKSTDEIEINEKISKLEKYRDYILECNQYINLTAIKEKDEFDKKHIVDSLLAYEYIRGIEGDYILDLGTGGGFPGIPLAIMFPEKNFVLVDSLNKKLKIIEDGAELLGIGNVSVLHGRAEDIGKNSEYREKFDLVVSRAVASMPVLLELVLPLVKEGGQFIAYKGPEVENEIKEAHNALKKLGGEVFEIVKPDQETLEHVLLFVNKVGKTPDMYPRKAGTPSKKPL